MDYKFEQFKSAGGKFGVYRITINRAGGFQLSPGFYFKNEIKTAHSAILFYDKNNQAVGLRFTPEKQEGAFKIIHRGNSATIAARSFFNAYGIDVEKSAGKFEPEAVENTEFGKLFVIKLDSKLL